MLSMKSIFENLTEHHVVETFVQWMAKENEMICCCSDGTRPVIFKVERIDYED